MSAPTARCADGSAGPARIPTICCAMAVACACRRSSTSAPTARHACANLTPTLASSACQLCCCMVALCLPNVMRGTAWHRPYGSVSILCWVVCVFLHDQTRMLLLQQSAFGSGTLWVCTRRYMHGPWQPSMSINVHVWGTRVMKRLCLAAQWWGQALNSELLAALDKKEQDGHQELEASLAAKEQQLQQLGALQRVRTNPKPQPRNLTAVFAWGAASRHCHSSVS